MILSLSLYALRMKREIKLISTSFFVFVILLLVGLIVKFIAGVPIVDMLLIILCLIAFNIYLIYDVNSLIEERGISSRDYFTLNILLYLDIIMNFIKLVNFIYKNLQTDEKDETLDKVKGFTEDLEKGIDAVKNFGKEKKEEEDEDDDEEDKKEKKGKKSKKEDKKGKKEDKKGKKDDKKGKKEEKKGKNKKKKKKEADDDEGGDIIKDVIGGLFG
jgi:ABC-type multidrug transport system fused ATPase/permease subunit